MNELNQFLNARIAEDERLAQAVVDTHEMWGWESYVAQAGMYDEPASEFATRHDPARVLAECGAKRRVVALHHDGGAFGWCAECDGHPPCDTLRALASAYADHSDYRDEWSA